MSKKISLGIVSLVWLLTLVVVPVVASAQSGDLFGIGYATATGLTSTDLRVTVANIINVALGLLGIIAVVIILVGGFKWMTAMGNEDKVGESKKLIAAGIIGLAIIVSAYAIANFVISSLVEATSN